MKNMQYSKCHSQEIVRLPSSIQPPAMLSSAKSPSLFKTINATVFCCTNCGYSERWLDDLQDLKELLKK